MWAFLSRKGSTALRLAVIWMSWLAVLLSCATSSEATVRRWGLLQVVSVPVAIAGVVILRRTLRWPRDGAELSGAGGCVGAACTMAIAIGAIRLAKHGIPWPFEIAALVFPVLISVLAVHMAFFALGGGGSKGADQATRPL